MDPDLVKMEDKEGNCLEGYFSEGCCFFKYPYKTSFKEHLRQIRELSVRNDDIFLCAYPKGGTHWVAEMTDMILRGSATFTEEHKGISIIERYTDSDIAEIPSPRFLDTHYRVQFLPKEVFEKKTKIILVIRNPKDCCVSYYHMAREVISLSDYQGSFEAFFEMFLEGKVPTDSWFDYTNDWDRVISENSLSVHVLYYEDLKQNLEDSVRGIAHFLGRQLDNETIKGIAECCQFQTMKKANATLKTKDTLRVWRKGANGFFRKGVERAVAKTVARPPLKRSVVGSILLGGPNCGLGYFPFQPVLHNWFNKGRGVVGDWKNYFTVAQNERFNKEYIRKMADCRHLNHYMKDMI